MNKSESIGKLTEALSKVQGILEGAKKESSNPFFKSRYADLTSVWDAIRKPLADNGLAVIQTGVYNADNPELISIETTLSHISGEWVSGIISVKPVKNDPQVAVACVTYLRRASLSAIVGVSPEDDDGEAATREVKPKTAMKDFRNKEADIPEDVEVKDNPLVDFLNSTPEEQKRTLNILSAAKKYIPKTPIEDMEEVETRVNFFRYLIKKGE